MHPQLFPLCWLEFKKLQSELPPGPAPQPQELRCTLGMTEQITFRAKMESDIQLARRCKPVCGLRLGFILLSLYFSIETEAWKNKPVCVTARKPPIPCCSLSKHAAETRPRHTRMQAHTTPTQTLQPHIYLHDIRAHKSSVCGGILAAGLGNKGQIVSTARCLSITRRKTHIQAGADLCSFCWEVKHTDVASEASLLSCAEFFSLLSVFVHFVFLWNPLGLADGGGGVSSADNSVSPKDLLHPEAGVKVFFSESLFSASAVSAWWRNAEAVLLQWGRTASAARATAFWPNKDTYTAPHCWEGTSWSQGRGWKCQVLVMKYRSVPGPGPKQMAKSTCEGTCMWISHRCVYSPRFFAHTLCWPSVRPNVSISWGIPEGT